MWFREILSLSLGGIRLDDCFIDQCDLLKCFLSVGRASNLEGHDRHGADADCALLLPNRWHQQREPRRLSNWTAHRRTSVGNAIDRNRWECKRPVRAPSRRPKVQRQVASDKDTDTSTSFRSGPSGDMTTATTGTTAPEGGLPGEDGVRLGWQTGVTLPVFGKRHLTHRPSASLRQLPGRFSSRSVSGLIPRVVLSEAVKS